MSNVKYLCVDMETKIIDSGLSGQYKELPLVYDRFIQIELDYTKMKKFFARYVKD